MDAVSSDELAIRLNIERWVVWRDSGDWARFASLWHDEAEVVTTYFSGSAVDYIALNRAGWDRGLRIHHFLGGSAIDISKGKAVAQTKMTIMQRVVVHEVEADIICHGRFYDLFERRADDWKLRLRRCIYDLDRLLPVEAGRGIPIDRAMLDEYPEGYKHLAYVQRLAGLGVRNNLPGSRGPELEALFRLGRSWLAGEPLDRDGLRPGPASSSSN